MQGLLFDDLPKYEKGLVEYPKLQYCFNGMETNLQKVIDYERASMEVVDADHHLVRLLQLVNNRLSDDIRLHYTLTKDMVTDWAAVGGITTQFQARSPLIGEYLQGNDYEFLVHSHEDIPLSSFTNNSYPDWKNLQPVKVAACKYHDSFPWLPSGNPEGKGDWAVIIIDLPALAIQYREWSSAVKKGLIQESQTSFLHKYVITGMLESFNRCKQLNRYIRLGNGLEVDHVRGSGRPAVVDYETRLLKEQYHFVSDRKAHTTDWPTLLRQTPVDASHDLSVFLDPIRGFETSQIRWLKALTQVPLWTYLLQHGKGENSQYRNRMKRLLKELKRDRGIQGIRDYVAISLVQDEFKRITDTLTRQ